MNDCYLFKTIPVVAVMVKKSSRGLSLAINIKFVKRPRSPGKDDSKVKNMTIEIYLVP